MNLSDLKLDSRYTKMTPEEMQGDASAKDFIRIAMLRTGGKPGAKPLSPDEVTDRASNIQWTDQGPVFKVKGTPPRGATHLDMDKILHGRFISKDLNQGKEIQEFVDRATKTESPAPAPPAPAPTKAPAVEAAVASEVAKAAVAKVEAKGAPPAVVAKVKAAAAAAEVEAKAKVLADKAAASKEEALQGLAGYGIYSFGEVTTFQKIKAGLIGMVAGIVAGFVVSQYTDQLANPVLQAWAVPIAASVVTTLVYAIF
jgi:hypothetical protein